MTAPAMLTAAILATALSGAPGTGVGIQVGNVCLSAPARPGGSYQPGTVYVTNTGSATEAISLHAGQMPSRQAGTAAAARHAWPVPPAWVTFSYPARLWVIPRHSVSLAPGQGASIPVTLHIPAGARDGRYEAALTASAAGPAVPGGGPQAVLGAAAVTFLEFSVDVPADCRPSSPPQPWWAAPPTAGTFPPAGWSYVPARDASAAPGLAGVWTYIPPRGQVIAPHGGTPPGWNPAAQMQAWTYGGGVGFVLNHVPGWRYLPGAGPLGTTLYQPPGGKLPAWASRLAAGDSYAIPAVDPGSGQAAIAAPAAGRPAQHRVAWIIAALAVCLAVLAGRKLRGIR